MEKSMGWRIFLIAALLAASIYFIYPPGEKIILGLDLKGGMHLVFKVETDVAVRRHTDSQVSRLKSLLGDASITVEKVARQGTNKIEITGLKTEDQEKIEGILDDEFKEWSYTVIGPSASVTLKELAEIQMKDQSVNQALETISNRINSFGVADPVIQREKEDNLLVQLPGVSDKDKERVLKLIKQAAVLEFKKYVAGPFATEEEALKSYNNALPEDLVIVKHTAKNDIKGVSVLKAESVIEGRELKKAQRSHDEYGAPCVAFSLDSEGARKFQKFTAANVGQKLAIVLDDRMVSAPVINGVLSYESIITGQFTVQDADDLALILRSGSLPASMLLEHEQSIGPSLGADSIRTGLIACVIGFFLVVAFMLWFYKGAGVNAVAALCFNVVFLLGALASLEATLTMPGIGGIILTLGMAVDANVLIFERIKEEMKAGKAPKAAIDAGFKKAFVTIFDSNLTTIISAIFLFQFGTSSIKGFAVTLILGITISMFTAIFVSRVIFDLWYGKKKKITNLSI